MYVCVCIRMYVYVCVCVCMYVCVSTTQIQNFSIIIKNLENRKNKYEKIIQIIYIE